MFLDNSLSLRKSSRVYKNITNLKSLHGAVTAENVSSFLSPVVASLTYSAAERSYGGLDVAPSEEKISVKH